MDTLPLFRRTVFDAGLEPWVVAVVGDSPTVARVWSTPCALVFIDGDNAAELQWALRTWSDTAAKIIFVSGSPFDAMKPWQRRFYFDQGGTLTSKFGIRHTPAVVSEAGSSLKISEIPLAPPAAAPGGGKSL